MENLENQDLTPATDPTPIPLPDMPSAEPMQPQIETVPAAGEPAPAEKVTEAVTVTEEAAPAPQAAPPAEKPAPAVAQSPKYEWDCGMAFPPPQKEQFHTASKKDQPITPPKPKRSIGRLILACTLVAAMALSGCVLSGAVVNSYWMRQNQELQQQLSNLQSKTDRLQAQFQNSSQNNGNHNSGNSNTGNNNNAGNTGTPGTLTPAQVYTQNVGAVVTITTNTASGSGFILTDDGYVVTNYHVIENALKVEITLSNSDSYPAEVIGYDATHDVAVLKADATGLPYVTLGSSDALSVGDQITVIGNPLGELTYTQTVGYISGKDRGISTDNITTNMLQTDASINSGNSGGPMFNMNGQVVGIITAKYSGTSSSGASIEGIGFAIPIDDVSKKIYDLIEFGYISGPYLGVGVRDMDQSVSQSFGLPMGAYVVTVEKTNCAYAAGVREKDIIVGLGQYSIESLNDLTSALQNFKPGDTTIIKVWRSGSILDLTITLDDRPH